MYLEYFGLTQAPFSATPNTQFLLELSYSSMIFKELIMALNHPDGFVKVTGVAGVGKTTLRRKVLSALHSHRNRYVVIDIPYPRVDVTGFFAAIAHELQISETPGPQLRDNVIAELGNRIAAGKRVSIVIDEGQCIPDTTLDALLDLATQELLDRKLVQVVIFAQTEFDDTLNTHRQRKLMDRMTASHTLSPVAEADIPRYVTQRLHLSGYSGDPLFSPRALQVLCNASRGIPRLINLLAHKAMIAACAAGASTVDATHVTVAVADTAAAKQPPTKSGQGWLSKIRNAPI
ncbi:MAG: AAA family ATPase [Pseudohongiellaceae bacterium]